MTQLELPQFQLGRYFDLLRRRRWHLLPAALVGLAVGSLVAILIPRYYVAETIIRILPRTVDPGASKQDRFLEETRKARVVIKNEALIANAIRELEWVRPDQPEDTESLRELCAEIADRIEVEQLWQGEPSVSSAMIEITYRDREGPKSAQFLNKLRDLYLDGEFNSILKAERTRLTELKNQEERHNKALEAAYNDKLDVSRRSGLSSGLKVLGGGQVFEQDPRLNEYRVVDGEIADLNAKIEGLTVFLAERRHALANMDPNKIVDPDTDPRVRVKLAPINLKIAQLKAELKNMRTRHQLYENLERILRDEEDKREEIIQRLQDSGQLDQKNPLYVALQLEIEAKTAELAGYKEELKERERRFAYLEQFKRELPEYETSLQKAQARIDEELRQLEQVHDRQQSQRDKVAQIELNRRDVVDVLRIAYTPPEPTYPNKFLIALLGAVLGFGAAVGLIFFLDLTQPSFKSYDEVQRALPIPVLGGVSYLELDEDLKAARRKRFRVGSFAIFVIALFASILALYFLAPVRLPSWLRDFFDLIFQPRT
ncbi:MAG: hypothetical protein H6832_06815 [Planctomycetes bacterium]|nr:hypothetical protein [Planctomycetota bacterium]MCB9918098.1 hypothetical protein [Planctomycetota bacterium]